MDFLLLLLAAIIGGLVGGSLAFVLARRPDNANAPKPKSRLFEVPRQTAKVYQFRPRS